MSDRSFLVIIFIYYIMIYILQKPQKGGRGNGEKETVSHH